MSRSSCPVARCRGWLWLAMVLGACGGPSEGTAPGDCTDRADNDGDGLFDCDDEGCAGSPDCEADADSDADADTDTDTDTDTGTGEADADLDGWTVAAGDCDDTNPDVHPGAEEVCNDGVDNDCDGSAGSCELSGTVSLALADGKLVGEQNGDQAGAWVATGDVDGDGLDDILVGAPGHDTGGSSAGAAYVVLGPFTGTVGLSVAEAKLVGESDYHDAGCAVATGDMDGDGIADLLIGAEQESTRGDRAGAAYLVLGPVTGQHDLSLADARLLGEDAYDFAGSAVATGDVTGDGVDDMLVGAEGDSTGASFAGAAYVVPGPAEGTFGLDSAIRFIGEYTQDYAGQQVSAGDLDGDGVADVLISAPENDEGGTTAGAVYVVSGPVAGTTRLADADAKLLGSSGDAAGAVHGAADVNGDGRADVLVGASSHHGAESYSGAVYLVLGPASGTVPLSLADARFEGQSGDMAGVSVCAGDLDGDGVTDVFTGLVGGREAKWSGGVYVLYGPFSGTLSASDASARLTGEADNDYAGQSLAIGDTDADGLDDLVIGTGTGGMDTAASGAAYVIHGSGG